MSPARPVQGPPPQRRPSGKSGLSNEPPALLVVEPVQRALVDRNAAAGQATARQQADVAVCVGESRMRAARHVLLDALRRLRVEAVGLRFHDRLL